MKILIFAGGHGQRLWPLSRKNSPKQFDKIFNGKSTLQLMVKKVEANFPVKDIIICTGKDYRKTIIEQVPQIPKQNIICEPERRDLAPAVGMNLFKLHQTGYRGPVTILWSDSLIENDEQFLQALQLAESLIRKDSNRFIYLGEKPRYANENLGWIEAGKKIASENGLDVHEYLGWQYRPPLQTCQTWFANKKHYWNPGYFISSVEFIVGLYETFMPKMTQQLKQIAAKPSLLDKIYPKLEKISFDDAILEKTNPEQAVMIKVNMGWSDPGTLYALKEVLQSSKQANVSQGKVVNLNSKDCLVINKNESQLATTIGLEGFIVINLPDTLLVCHKNSVPQIKKLLEKLTEAGYDNYL